MKTFSTETAPFGVFDSGGVRFDFLFPIFIYFSQINYPFNMTKLRLFDIYMIALLAFTTLGRLYPFIQTCSSCES